MCKVYDSRTVIDTISRRGSVELKWCGGCGMEEVEEYLLYELDKSATDTRRR